jgi:two-component system, NarL family, nitrate/nitrite response regulator NarL
MARDLRPDVILMDISMPILNGLEATRQILAGQASAKIVILSAHDEEGYVERARALGAVGFVAKQQFAETLMWVIHEVALGRTLSDPVTTAAANPAKDGPSARGATPARSDRLTPRDSALLRLVAEGSRKGQIASELRMSLIAVERALEALMAKLGILTLANLARYAVASGSVESDVVLTIT